MLPISLHAPAERQGQDCVRVTAQGEVDAVFVR
jgi:hypothetical protein